MFSEFQQENVSAQLLIMGAPPITSCLGIGEKPQNVHFLGHVDDATSYLTGVDAFCLASRWEGMPITVIEALATGTVVIATNVGGIREMVDNTCGLLVDSVNSTSTNLLF